MLFVRAFAEEGESGVAGFKGGARTSKKGNMNTFKKTAAKGSLTKRGTSTRKLGGLSRGKSTRSLG
jgi:hypothetical protein